jgi:hypothetical protein
MNNLILDVKIVIASLDEHVWYWFYRYDDEFKYYAKTKGVNYFAQLFTVCTRENHEHYTMEQYYLLNKLHRVGSPAIIYQGKYYPMIKNNKFIISRKIRNYNMSVKNYQVWCYNGKIHNTDKSKPSVVSNEYDAWYDKGKLHRKNLPAMIYKHKDSKVWYHRGKIHNNNDLPAVMYGNYNLDWYHKGKRHRENDLPAVISDVCDEWWYMGKCHRENDLPALIHKDDDIKEWYCQGKCHRENDLPAILDNGCQRWVINGNLHRTNNLPAVIYTDGTKEWWVHGKKLKNDLII